MIYVFGSNVVAQRFIRTLIDLEIFQNVSIVADEFRLWIEEVSGLLPVFFLKSTVELTQDKFYDFVEFKNARYVVLLYDDPTLNQEVIAHVMLKNPRTRFVIPARFSTDAIRLLEIEERRAGTNRIIIIEDLERLAMDMALALTLDLKHAPVVEIPSPPLYWGKDPLEINVDFNNALEVVGIKRGDQVDLPNRKIQKGDTLLLWVNEIFPMKMMTRFADRSLIRFELEEKVQEKLRRETGNVEEKQVTP